jgi:hypothetical protein
VSDSGSPTAPHQEVVLVGQTRWLKGVLRSLCRDSKHPHMTPAQLGRLQAAVRSLIGCPASGRWLIKLMFISEAGNGLRQFQHLRFNQCTMMLWMSCAC